MKAPWRIGVDVGGTFTDLVVRDAAGEIAVFKVPSVPADPSEGVLSALTTAAAALGLDVGGVLAECSLFVHGSTVATNTILEGKGARVGLLTTEGFRDHLEIRRGIRENQWDHRRPFPPVLVPRYLRLPVRERLDRDGNEVTPVHLDDVEAAAATFTEEGVESAAVCLINSFRNPVHEHACAEALRASGSWDGDWVSVSSAVAPILGEYERTSTVVVNAALAPRVVSYLRALDDRLRRLGLTRPILLVQSNGGAVSVDQVGERPVNLLLSGPAAGVGALNLYRQTAGTGNLVSMEIGGTSCDVTLMSEGDVAVSDELMIGGYHVGTPSVDIHTVGAGGGTIAGVDDGGLLFVGPQGAGARPGPACYGFGGTEPTVTDAQLVLGRLRPGPYAGGAVSLDDGAARQAVERSVAKPLGLDVDTAAAGIILLLEQHLLHAVERISTERGHDPRRFTLVAAGGAGPMHGASVGRALGCPRVYVPRQAGAFCAIGMLHADVRLDELKVVLADLDRLAADPTAVDELEAGFAELESRAGQGLQAEGFGPDDSVLERALDLRYRGQLWSIRVDIDRSGVDGHGVDRNGVDGRRPLDVAVVRRAFEAEHERLYGHFQPGGAIEVTSLRVTGRGLLEPGGTTARPPATEPPAPLETRPVYLDAVHGWVETPVYAGSALLPGHRVEGPLLVEEATTTVVVGPDDVLEVDPSDNLVILLRDPVATTRT